MKQLDPVSNLCVGLDFEVARERLAEQVGAAARRVVELKANPDHRLEDLQAARAELQAAQVRWETLQPAAVATLASPVRPQ